MSAFALTEFQPQPAQIDLSADCFERVKNELVRNSESLFVGWVGLNKKRIKKRD